LDAFHKLDHIGILMAADQVCGSSRRAARDESALWRRIVMHDNADLSLVTLNHKTFLCVNY
jgi:hypothetical protein